MAPQQHLKQNWVGDMFGESSIQITQKDMEYVRSFFLSKISKKNF